MPDLSASDLLPVNAPTPCGLCGGRATLIVVSECGIPFAVMCGQDFARYIFQTRYLTRRGAVVECTHCGVLAGHEGLHFHGTPLF